jgi:hypothetical protein
MKTISFIIILLIIFASNLSANRYYVDPDHGNDSDSGKTETTAWQTLDNVNGPLVPFNENDTISFKCGTRIIGQTLLPPSNYLVFNSYGIGDRPVIDRNGDNPSYWRAKDTGDSLQAFDTTRSGGYCVDLDSKDHITFSGIKFVRGFNTNIGIWSCNYIRFESCNIDSAFQTYDTSAAPGMIYAGGDHGNPTTHLTIRNSTLMYSRYGHGGYFDPVHQLLLEYDTIAYNGANGFQTYSAYTESANPDICYQDTIRYCVVRQNDLTNTYEYQILDNTMNNSAVYYNVIEANTTTGSNSTCIRIQNDYNTPPHNVLWANNTIIMHGTGEAFDWGDLNTTGIDNITVKNNIIYLDKPAQYGMYFYGSVGSHNVITNNLYYYPAGGTHLFHSGPDNHIYDYPDISTWKTASNNFTTPAGGYEINSVTDPDTSTFINSDLINLQLKNSSNAILAGVGVGFTQDFIGTPVGNPPDIGAYQNSSYLSGTLSASKTVSGNVAFTGDVTVPSGITLTISPETHIKVGSGVNIMVYGTLHCLCNFWPGNITFDSLGSNNHWGSIIFDGSSTSSSIIKNASLTNCDGIQFKNGANGTIFGCSLTNSLQGIFIYNSDPEIFSTSIINPHQNGIYGFGGFLSPSLSGTTIIKTVNPYQNEGLYIGGWGIPVVQECYISGFGTGAYFGGGCNAQLSTEFHLFCNNTITGNVFGVVTVGSTTMAGQDDGTGVWNSICNNTVFDVWTQNSGYLCGYWDYWGSNPQIIADGTSRNDIYEILPENPCGESNKSIRSNMIAANSLKKSGGDNIFAGLQLEKEGKIDDAINFYKGLINMDQHIKFALLKLAVINFKYSRPEIINYFENLISSSNRNYEIIKNLLADIYLRENNFDNAITAFNDVINNDSTGYEGINARFEKLFAYLNIRNNVQVATQILSQLKEMQLTDQESLIKIKIAEDLIIGTNIRISNKLASGIGIAPHSYYLSQNFPNPFNPVTTIRYQIPKPGVVTLKVYDIIGREVATLVNENKIEGSYDYSFNAARLASGVYIYQLKVNDYVSSKKMILLK